MVDINTHDQTRGGLNNFESTLTPSHDRFAWAKDSATFARGSGSSCEYRLDYVPLRIQSASIRPKLALRK